MRLSFSGVMLAVAALLAGGCTFGPKLRNYAPAQGPKGVMLTAGTAQGTFKGELLEVRDAGIVLLVGPRIRLLPYEAILSAETEGPDAGTNLISGKAPKPAVREHLRLLSRFPQGLNPELERQLLDAYGQSGMAGATP